MVEQKSTGIEVIETLKAKPIVYRDQRCVTLGLVDQMHERRIGHSKEAFNRRKDRFKERHHYFVVPYIESQQILNGGAFNAPPKKGGHKGDTILITEKGYCLLAKVFDDDRAWAVQEELVEGYFQAVERTSESSDILKMMGKLTDGMMQIGGAVTQLSGVVGSLADRVDRLESVYTITRLGPRFSARRRLNELVEIHELKVDSRWKDKVVRQVHGEAGRLGIELFQVGDGMIEMPMTFQPWAEKVMGAHIREMIEIHRTPLFATPA